MAFTEAEHKKLQADLQKQRDINKRLVSQAVDTASNQQVTSNIEQAVKQMATKLGEYDPEDFSDIADLLTDSSGETRKNADLLKTLEGAISDASEDTMDDKSDEEVP